MFDFIDTHRYAKRKKLNLKHLFSQDTPELSKTHKMNFLAINGPEYKLFLTYNI